MRGKRILAIAVLMLAGAAYVVVLARRWAVEAAPLVKAAVPKAVTGHAKPAQLPSVPAPPAVAELPTPHAVPVATGMHAHASVHWVSRKRDEYMAQLRDVPVSGPVRVLIGLEGRASDLAARMAAVKKLTRRLSEADVVALRMFLDFRAGEQDPAGRLPVLDFEGLKNDALAVLLEQDRFPAGLGEQLVAMWHDSAHDNVWRIYCLQYMAEYYTRRWPTLSGQEAGQQADPQTAQHSGDAQDERAQVEGACWAALDQRSNEMAGTALIGLENLSRTYDRIAPSRVRAAAVAIAADDTCGEASRITALSMCAQLGCRESLPTVRIHAQAGLSEPVRMAAIAALGALGEPQDQDLLSLLATDKTPRMRKVAESALARLRAPAVPARGRRLLDIAQGRGTNAAGD